MSLVWEGLDLQPAHRRWRFWIAEGRDELPDVRVSSEVIAFRRGRLHQPATADRRMLVVNGYIQEASLLAFRAQHDTLKGLLDPERAEPGTLIDDFEDGMRRWVKAVPRNLIPKYGGDATRLLSIELEALDPYWYSTHGTLILDDGYVLDAGWTLDSSREVVVVPTSDPYDFSIDILGTADISRVRVAVDAPSVGPLILRNLIAGADPIGFNFPTLTGGSLPLVVDNDARTVAQGTVTKRSSLGLEAGNVHGEYLRLRPGNNTLRVYGKPTTVRLLFYPTWL